LSFCNYSSFNLSSVWCVPSNGIRYTYLPLVPSLYNSVCAMLCSKSIKLEFRVFSQVERHALVMHDRFDPGSTISIMAMQRSHAGIDVRLDEDDEDEEKDDPGDYSTEPLLGTQRNPLRPRFSAQKIVFEGSATEDSRDSTAYAGPRRAIEAWLMGSQLPHGSDYDASNDDAFQVGSTVVKSNAMIAMPLIIS